MERTKSKRRLFSSILCRLSTFSPSCDCRFVFCHFLAFFFLRFFAWDFFFLFPFRSLEILKLRVSNAYFYKLRPVCAKPTEKVEVEKVADNKKNVRVPFVRHSVYDADECRNVNFTRTENHIRSFHVDCIDNFSKRSRSTDSVFLSIFSFARRRERRF